MGEHNISNEHDEQQFQNFTKALLCDLQALEQMLTDGMLETGVQRIGAEQEMFLVDSAMNPAPVAMEILDYVKDRRLTTEIGKFNLEANLTPLEFKGSCLSDIEKEIQELVGLVREGAKHYNADVLLVGILPTLQLSDLTLESMTPNPRYYELNRVITKLRGGNFHIFIKGLDEIHLAHDNVMLEAANTSFQVHLQVPPEDFVNAYNWAQVVIAPTLSGAVNSPLLLGRRLWQETRLALFQHSVDMRSETHLARSHPTRVSFGDSWVKESILEIFREDVTRFRIILTQQLEENSLEVLSKGNIPRLAAWRLHNGTIWRWNRACYGRTNGKPGLRIENRALPAGPTILDEVANQAFFLGLMTALPQEYGDVTKRMSFDDAKDNFFAAARHGLKAQLTWIDKQVFSAWSLILNHLLPLAREGLEQRGIDSKDIDRYLGVYEKRVRSERTGARWMLESLANMKEQGRLSLRLRLLTEDMKKNQQSGLPVYCWELAKMCEEDDWMDNFLTIGQVMVTDLFTVRPEDVVDLAASLMHWKHIRHVPVEDNEGRLVGIISHRDLLLLLTEDLSGKRKESVLVRDIMKANPVAAPPDMPTLDAINLMREHNIGCLPVVEDGKLIGIITAYDFLAVSERLFREQLKRRTERNNEAELQYAKTSQTQ
jgi:CBS domain-containing protein